MYYKLLYKLSVLQVLASLILLAIAIHTVSGRSGGAPLQACVSLTPQHSGNAAQTSQSPHVVDLSDFNVTVDDDTGDVTIYYEPDTMYASECVLHEGQFNCYHHCLCYFSHTSGDRRGNVL